MSGILSYGLWLLTGARVSELLHIKLSMYKLAILIFTVKVEKYVVYIFRKICVQRLKWLKEKSLISGYIFLNRFGERITTLA